MPYSSRDGNRLTGEADIGAQSTGAFDFDFVVVEEHRPSAAALIAETARTNAVAGTASSSTTATADGSRGATPLRHRRRTQPVRPTLRASQPRCPVKAYQLRTRRSVATWYLPAPSAPPSAELFQLLREAWIGFEPTYDGFANRCLTTWLPRHQGAAFRRSPRPRTQLRANGANPAGKDPSLSGRPPRGQRPSS